MFKVRQRNICLQKDLLCDIKGIFCIFYKLISDAVHHSFIQRHQFFKSLMITRSGGRARKTTADMQP